MYQNMKDLNLCSVNNSVVISTNKLIQISCMTWILFKNVSSSKSHYKKSVTPRFYFCFTSVFLAFFSAYNRKKRDNLLRLSIKILATLGIRKFVYCTTTRHSLKDINFS